MLSRARNLGALVLTFVVLAGIAGVLVVGRPTDKVAAAPPIGQDPPAPSGAPVQPTASLAPNCSSTGLRSFVTFDGPARSVAIEAAAAAAVIIGTVSDVQAPVWNTIDGTHAPLKGTWPHGLRIYTPVTVAVTSTAKGAVQGSVTVLVPGGAIGCDQQLVEDTAIPDSGAGVVVFLTASMTLEGKPDNAHLAAMQAWPTNATGDVLTPVDGQLAPETFNSLVQQATAP